MAEYSSLAIANEFLERARKDGQSLTQMHVQKLVYLAHGWNLAVNGWPLTEDRFEAWDYGPVIRKLYDALRRHGARPIDRLVRWGDDTDFGSDDGGVARAALDREERGVIDKVWQTYGRYPAFRLSALTHADKSPWADVYEKGQNHPISNDKIWDYFSDLAARDD